MAASYSKNHLNSGEKILVFATQHMPAGGIESHLQEFCLHLSQSGVTIDLIITNSRMDERTEDFFRRICNKVYLGKYGESSFRSFWLLAVGILSCRFKYSAFYTNGQGESILRLKKMIRAKKWIHHHHTSGDAADHATWGKQYQKVLRSADKVIACSQRNAGMMKSYLGREVMVIPCFSRKIDIPTNFRKREKIRFGYYGRLIPEKGIDLICRLSADLECQHLEFHIWGEGKAYPKTFFNRFPNVRYHSSFSGLNELKEVMKSIDAFLLLSRHPEGLPICLLEVMSAGIPWLATDRGGITDIACDPCSTRVISAGAEYRQIKEAVLQLASDLTSGQLQRKAQISLYDEMFSASKITHQWRVCLGLN